MNLQRTAIYSAILAATMGLTACSGSDSSTSSSAADVTGRITAFGSVYINGVEYETNGTNIIIDGQSAQESDLKVGMIITLHGSDNGANGNATSISFTDELEGFVMSNDPTGGLVVMGYTIITDTQTNFEGFTLLTELAVNDVVEISGYPDGNGNIHATFIEKKTQYQSGSEVEVKGIVSGLVPDTSFTLGSLTIDITNADTTEAPNLADGMYVEVKGTSAPIAGVFAATKVEMEDDGIDGDEGDEIEVEGILNAIDTTANTITVGNNTYNMSANAEIEDVTVGDLVEIEMEVVNDTMLVTEVEKEDADDDHPNKIEIEAKPDATDTAAGTLTIAGVVINVNPNTTVMLDNSTTPEHYFNLGSINLTDRIEVEAIPDGAGGYTAVTIERVASSDTYVELEGPYNLDATTGNMLIAGIQLDISGVGSIPTCITADSCSKVSAKGSLSNGTLIVTTIEAE